MVVQTYNPTTQEALKCGVSLGCVVNSGLSGTTVRLPEKQTNKNNKNHTEKTPKGEQTKLQIRGGKIFRITPIKFQVMICTTLWQC